MELPETARPPPTIKPGQNFEFTDRKEQVKKPINLDPAFQDYSIFTPHEQEDRAFDGYPFPEEQTPNDGEVIPTAKQEENFVCMQDLQEVGCGIAEGYARPMLLHQTTSLAQSAQSQVEVSANIDRRLVMLSDEESKIEIMSAKSSELVIEDTVPVEGEDNADETGFSRRETKTLAKQASRPILLQGQLLEMFSAENAPFTSSPPRQQIPQVGLIPGVEVGIVDEVEESREVSPFDYGMKITQKEKVERFSLCLKIGRLLVQSQALSAVGQWALLIFRVVSCFIYSYYLGFLTDDNYGWFNLFSIVAEAAFMIELVVEMVVTSSMKKTLFLSLDAIALIPFVWVLNKLLDVEHLKFFLALKIGRACKALHYLDRDLAELARFQPSSVKLGFKVFHLFIGFGLLAQVCGIAWYLACSAGASLSDDEPDFLTVYDVQKKAAGPFLSYFLMTTLSTVGLGDVTPQSEQEMANSIVLLLGAIILAVFAAKYLEHVYLENCCSPSLEDGRISSFFEAISRINNNEPLPRSLRKGISAHLLLVNSSGGDPSGPKLPKLSKHFKQLSVHLQFQDFASKFKGVFLPASGAPVTTYRALRRHTQIIERSIQQFYYQQDPLLTLENEEYAGFIKELFSSLEACYVADQEVVQICGQHPQEVYFFTSGSILVGYNRDLMLMEAGFNSSDGKRRFLRAGRSSSSAMASLPSSDSTAISYPLSVPHSRAAPNLFEMCFSVRSQFSYKFEQASSGTATCLYLRRKSWQRLREGPAKKMLLKFKHSHVINNYITSFYLPIRSSHIENLRKEYQHTRYDLKKQLDEQDAHIEDIVKHLKNAFSSSRKNLRRIRKQINRPQMTSQVSGIPDPEEEEIKFEESPQNAKINSDIPAAKQDNSHEQFRLKDNSIQSASSISSSDDAQEIFSQSMLSSPGSSPRPQMSGDQWLTSLLNRQILEEDHARSLTKIKRKLMQEQSSAAAMCKGIGSGSPNSKREIKAQIERMKEEYNRQLARLKVQALEKEKLQEQKRGMKQNTWSFEMKGDSVLEIFEEIDRRLKSSSGQLHLKSEEEEALSSNEFQQVQTKVEEVFSILADVLHNYYLALEDLREERSKVNYLEESLMKDQSGFGIRLLNSKVYSTLRRNFEKKTSEEERRGSIFWPLVGERRKSAFDNYQFKKINTGKRSQLEDIQEQESNHDVAENKPYLSKPTYQEPKKAYLKHIPTSESNKLFHFNTPNQHFFQFEKIKEEKQAIQKEAQDIEKSVSKESDIFNLVEAQGPPPSKGGCNTGSILVSERRYSEILPDSEKSNPLSKAEDMIVDAEPLKHLSSAPHLEIQPMYQRASGTSESRYALYHKSTKRLDEMQDKDEVMMKSPILPESEEAFTLNASNRHLGMFEPPPQFCKKSRTLHAVSKSIKQREFQIVSQSESDLKESEDRKPEEYSEPRVPAKPKNEEPRIIQRGDRPMAPKPPLPAKKEKEDPSGDKLQQIDKVSYFSAFKMIPGSDSNSLINKTPNGQNMHLEHDSTPMCWREVAGQPGTNDSKSKSSKQETIFQLRASNLDILNLVKEDSKDKKEPSLESDSSRKLPDLSSRRGLLKQVQYGTQIYRDEGLLESSQLERKKKKMGERSPSNQV